LDDYINYKLQFTETYGHGLLDEININIMSMKKYYLRMSVIFCCFICSIFACSPYLFRNFDASFEARDLDDFIGQQDFEIDVMIMAAKQHAENASYLWTDAQVRYVALSYNCVGTNCELISGNVNISVRFKIRTLIQSLVDESVIGANPNDSPIFNSYAVAETSYFSDVKNNWINATAQRVYEVVEDRYTSSAWRDQAIGLEDAMNIAFINYGNHFAEQYNDFDMKLMWFGNWTIAISSNDEFEDSIRFEIDPNDGSVTIVDNSQ
jgi:hypothetical protein